MPRTARVKSKTGIYHIMFRGINGQTIFEDREDFLQLRDTLKTVKEKSRFELYAYCLMRNHFHLLIKEGHEGLGTIFRRMGSGYVNWYNWKYHRRGPLFQDRFRSEAVETNDYFLTVIRYIHRNPLRAGLVTEIDRYPWSSYTEYIYKPLICDTNYALGLFSRDKRKARALFAEFHMQDKDAGAAPDEFPGLPASTRISDTEATAIIKRISGAGNPVEVQKLEKWMRDDIIRRCRKEGLSIRQMERLTGISFGVIRKIK